MDFLAPPLSPNDFPNFTKAYGQKAAIALNDIGQQLFLAGNQKGAKVMFDSAANVLRAPTSMHAVALASKLKWGSDTLEQSPEYEHRHPPDTFQEDECDVGPRPFLVPISLSIVEAETSDSAILEACVIFNKALAHQGHDDPEEALAMYESVARTVADALQYACDSSRNLLLELAMLTHNNIGQILYESDEEEDALANFQTSLIYAKQMGVSPDDKDYRLALSTVLSNWCRIHWMRCEINDDVVLALREILCLRVAALGQDHVDVACAHYNLGLGEYARQNYGQALVHLLQYLNFALHSNFNKCNAVELDPIPALIYVLLIKYEDKDDKMAHELVRGLRALQDKRQDLGARNHEVASVLNYVGTLLFHQRELEPAMVFFQEELRMEEELADSEDDVTVSVTCNNIGRVFQELGKFPEAIVYYQRAVRSTVDDSFNSSVLTNSGNNEANIILGMSSVPSSAINLYSTVWYNLGLIFDKMGSQVDAIKAFQMALRLRQTVQGPDHSDVACLLYNVGVLQMEQQQLQEAATSFREALRIRLHATRSTLIDDHFVTTLQKLASLQKQKGNLEGAIETYKMVLQLLDLLEPHNGNRFHQYKSVGMTLREMAELHHGKSELPLALSRAKESAQVLHMCRRIREVSAVEHLSCVEQEALALLLIGSLHHEMCDPMAASLVYQEAANTVGVASCAAGAFGLSTLSPLFELSQMLASFQCAPGA
jgi:tetratricopeptide (TPR) repeat protein